MIDWFVDLGLAYVGGIVMGAPVGLVLRATTGTDDVLTATILVAMGAILLWRRLRRRRTPLF